MLCGLQTKLKGMTNEVHVLSACEIAVMRRGVACVCILVYTIQCVCILVYTIQCVCILVYTIQCMCIY